jgi:hypothetical protein
MKFAALASLALLFLVDSASAQSLYLTCKATSYPDLNFTTIYKVSPANARDRFLDDMIVEGLVGVIVNKAESWVVTLPQGRISSPEDNSGPVFTDATVTDARISAQTRTPIGNNYSYDLNRITGKLTYEIYLANEVTSAWRKKHGGTLPPSWKWEQVCTASSRAKI